MKKKIVPVVLILIIAIVAVINLNNEKSEVEGFIETAVVPHYSQVAGTVAEVPVTLGQKVKKGDVLLVIDDTDGKYRISQQEQNLIKQQATLAQLEGAYDYEIIMQGINQVTVMQESCLSAEHKVSILKEQYNDSELLYEAGAISEDALKEIEHQLALAESNYNSMLAQLDNAKQQLNMKQGSQGSDSQIEIAKASLLQATADLEKAKDDLEKYTIRAEEDGIVLSLSYKKGGIISVGSPVADVAVIAENYWVGYVPVEKLDQLEYGNQVEIQSDNLSEKAEICYIDVKSQYASEEYANSMNRNKETVKVKCLLAKNTKMKAGMAANLKL